MKLDSLATYAHFMPDDDDRAREIMNMFFAPAPGTWQSREMGL